MTVGAAEARGPARGWSSSRPDPAGGGPRRVERVLERVLGEYQQLCEGHLDLLQSVVDRGNGAINACGDESPEPWAVTYVRYADQAVMPLAVGGYRHVLELGGVLSEQDLADESRWAPPRVLVDGAPRYFQPTYGRYLLGIVRSGARIVMLVAIGEQVGVLLLDSPESQPEVLFIGAALGFRELDVDVLAGLRPPRRAAGRKATRRRAVAAATQAHHRRIAVGDEFETGDGPAVPEVVRLCFEALAERTIDAARRCPGGRARGVSFVRPTLWAIYRLGLRGSLDPCGRIGELHRQLSEADPSFRLGASQLSDAVKLLEKTGCCLIMRMSRRIWKIQVVGLSDPRSQLHRQLCKETGGRFLFGRTANAGEVDPRHRPCTSCGASAGEGGGSSTSGSAPSSSSQGAATGEADPTGEGLAALVEAHKQVVLLMAELDELRGEVDELRGRVGALEQTSGPSARERKASEGGLHVPEGPKTEDGRGKVIVAGRQQRGSERNGESIGESDSCGRSLAEEPRKPKENRQCGNSEAVARVESAIEGIVVALSEVVDGAARVNVFRCRVAALRELVAGSGSAWVPGVGPGSAATRGPPGAYPPQVHAVRPCGAPALRLRPCTTISTGVVSLILDSARA